MEEAPPPKQRLAELRNQRHIANGAAADARDRLAQLCWRPRQAIDDTLDACQQGLGDLRDDVLVARETRRHKTTMWLELGGDLQDFCPGLVSQAPELNKVRCRRQLVTCESGPAASRRRKVPNGPTVAQIRHQGDRIRPSLGRHHRPEFGPFSDRPSIELAANSSSRPATRTQQLHASTALRRSCPAMAPGPYSDQYPIPCGAVPRPTWRRDASRGTDQIGCVWGLAP